MSDCMASADVRRAFVALTSRKEDYPRWLDFGCGSGRIARHLLGADPPRELWGVDVDAPAVAWCARRFPGSTFRTISADPPSPLPASHFDVVVSGSVFTHLAEDAQSRWLSELHRLLRPGGLLITCTHSPKLTFMRPDLRRRNTESSRSRGFLFAPGGGASTRLVVPLARIPRADLEPVVSSGAFRRARILRVSGPLRLEEGLTASLYLRLTIASPAATSATRPMACPHRKRRRRTRGSPSDPAHSLAISRPRRASKSSSSVPSLRASS